MIMGDIINNMAYIIIDYCDVSRYTVIREISLSRKRRFLRKKSGIESYRRVRIFRRGYAEMGMKVIGGLKSLKICCMVRNIYRRL
jgi:hypothetical protein